MQIIIEVDESMLHTVAAAAVKNAFFDGGSYYDRGVGTKRMYQQAEEWAKAQDYSPLIQELAPGIVREVVRDTLIETIKAEAKRQVRTLRDTGELRTLFGLE